MGAKDKLVEIARKATGRQLSQAEIERAHHGYEYTSFMVHYSIGVRPDERKGTGSEIMSLEEKSIQVTTNDFSNLGHTHTGWYTVFREERIYTGDGLLKGRLTVKNHPAGAKCFSEEVLYDPPGAFFAKVIDKFEGN